MNTNVNAPHHQCDDGDNAVQDKRVQYRKDQLIGWLRRYGLACVFNEDGTVDLFDEDEGVRRYLDTVPYEDDGNTISLASRPSPHFR